MILKVYFFILLNLGLSFALFAQLPHADRIEVRAASFSLETIVSVGCSNFEKSMGPRTKFRQISNTDTIAAFAKLISKLKKANQESDLDVRVKVYLFGGNDASLSILCMDVFGNILLNGQQIKKNRKLIKLIKQCLPYEVL